MKTEQKIIEKQNELINHLSKFASFNVDGYKKLAELEIELAALKSQAKELSDEDKTRKEIRSILLDKFKQFWVDKKDEYDDKDEVDITLGEKSMLNICVDYFYKPTETD